VVSGCSMTCCKQPKPLEVGVDEAGVAEDVVAEFDIAVAVGVEVAVEVVEPVAYAVA